MRNHRRVARSVTRFTRRGHAVEATGATQLKRSRVSGHHTRADRAGLCTWSLERWEALQSADESVKVRTEATAQGAIYLKGDALKQAFEVALSRIRHSVSRFFEEQLRTEQR